VNIEFDEIRRSFPQRSFASIFCSSLSSFEFLLIYSQTVFFSHQTRQIDREAVCVVQTPDILSAQLLVSVFFRLGGILFEKLFTSIECSVE